MRLTGWKSTRVADQNWSNGGFAGRQISRGKWPSSTRCLQTYIVDLFPWKKWVWIQNSDLMDQILRKLSLVLTIWLLGYPMTWPMPKSQIHSLQKGSVVLPSNVSYPFASLFLSAFPSRGAEMTESAGVASWL
jgi:hypothetical protein